MELPAPLFAVMMLPTIADLKEGFVRLREREALTWSMLLNPVRVLLLLYKYKYVHFFIVGGSGVALNLGITWALTTFVFGLESYFNAYLIGIAANLIWNFMLYSFALFKTKGDHMRRLSLFVAYFIAMTWFNTLIVRTIVGIVGVEYYLVVIGGVILMLSTVNFFVFKLSLFKESI